MAPVDVDADPLFDFGLVPPGSNSNFVSVIHMSISEAVSEYQSICLTCARLTKTQKRLNGLVDGANARIRDQFRCLVLDAYREYRGLRCRWSANGISANAICTPEIGRLTARESHPMQVIDDA